MEVLQRMKNELCQEHWNHKKMYFHDHQELVYCCAFNLPFVQITFFQRLILFKELSKTFKELSKTFKDFPRISHNFSIGLFQKKSTPPWWKAQFFYTPPPIHLDFQNCLSPAPLRISKFKDPPTHLDFHKIVTQCDFILHSMLKNPFRHLDDLFIK